MSLFYLTVRNINKGKQSAIASASYRSGQSLYSERDNETKSYGKREVEPDSFILSPKHAPEWVSNREVLWNEVEKVEKNWNSRLAREVLVALPRELSDEDQKSLLVEYVKENFTDNGMVADVSIHRDRNENPHAHIMLTVRPFNEDGSWGNKKKKEYIKENGEFVLDESGKKKYKTISLTNWNDKETLQSWRKNFSEKINEWYLKKGINEKVSHESYEKQGIDRLPKQRLSLTSYRIEQREKDNARKEGSEYEPKTYYGKLNKQIDETNKQIDELNNEIKRAELKKEKIISLSDYRKTFDEDRLNQLNEIRKNANLSTSDWKAIKTVAGRLDGFVDYRRASNNLVKLENWKKQLDRNSRIINAEKTVLSKSNQVFKTDPKKVMLYGFKPTYFKEELKGKLQGLKEKIEKHNATMKVFNELHQSSKRVLEIQREFVNEEFAFLYPELNSKIKEETPEVLKIKEKYVELFREEGETRKSIPELSNSSLQDLKLSNLRELISDWKEVKESLLIAERTKEKRKGEYKEAYQNFNAKKVYDSSIKYTESKEQIVEKEERKSVLQEKLFEHMVSSYPKARESLIREIPSEIQSKLLELQVKGESTGKLSKDLELVKAREHNSEWMNEFEKGDSTSQNAGDLFSSLIQSAQQQDGGKDDLEAKRQKKKRKLYNDLGEQEL
jgi:hypothetical protein